MSNGLFEVLASEDAREQERIARNRATIAIQTRAKQRFEKYVSAAVTQDERDARIEVIASDLDDVLGEVVAEHHFLTIEEARAIGREALGGGHPAGCECGFCKNKGNPPGSEKEGDGDEDDEPMEKDASAKTSKTCPECEKAEMRKDDHVYICPNCDYETSEPDDDDDDDERTSKTAKIDIKQASASASEFPWEHVAADVETGDSYAQERVDLPSNKTDGLGEASPKIDKSNVPADGLKSIDVPSEKHPLEQQSVTDRADYDAEDFDPSSPVRDRIDADAPLQPEHNVADKTETWTGTEGQAAPVTSNVLAKWTVLP